MHQQSMEPPEESEYSSSSFQQKLHPRPRRFPRAKTLVEIYFMLLTITLVVSALIGDMTPPHSSTITVATWLFWLLLFSIAFLGLATLFRYDWSRHSK